MDPYFKQLQAKDGAGYVSLYNSVLALSLSPNN